MENAEFLANVSIFKNLSESALLALAAISTEYEFDEEAIIAYQRDVANRLTIVADGRLFSKTVDREGPARESRSYLPGQFFEDTWLFAPHVNPATVKGAEAGRLIIIEGSDFLEFLDANPGAVKELAPAMDEEGNPVGLSTAAWAEARKKMRHRRSNTPNVGLLPDELLEYYSRRSGWYLLIKLIPAFLLMILAPVAYFLIPEGTGLMNFFRWGVTGLLLFGGIFLFVLRWIDWRNDYFVITSKHLLHREFALRSFRIDLVKVPIGQIQSVEILKPSLLATTFDIGDAKITTAAAAGIVLFDNISDPELVKETLDRLAGRVRHMDAAQIQQVMRQSLEQHFEIDPHLRDVSEDDPEVLAATTAAATQREQSGVGRSIQRRFGWRVEENNTITYRKSVFVLIQRIGLPLIGYFLLTIAGMLLARAGLTGRVMAIIMAVLFLANSLWFIWQLENWRNDTFQLTDQYVLDIDRVPFGFGESRKQAALKNIQNVNAERPGFLATLFNYGNVSIDTAGAPSDIVFDHVPNPAVIQSDIFRRLDELRQKRRIQEGSDRRQEYVVMLDVYRQEMEEDRIPRRLPESQDTYE